MENTTPSSNICSNCGQTVEKKFCSNCGQKYIAHKENAWHLVLHFFEDITHFDSRFYKSMLPLLFQPGFLTQQYNEGKRTKYLNPVRMYIFISFVFFLVKLMPTTHLAKGNPDDVVSYDFNNDGVKKVTRKQEETELNDGVNTTISFGTFKLAVKSDSTKVYSQHQIKDSIEAIEAKPNLSYIERLTEAQSFKLSHMDKDVLKENLSHNYGKNIPKVMFILLPLFALLLKLLYRRSRIYFVDHAIFSIHFHCFVFLNFLLQHLLSALSSWHFILNLLLWLGLLVYLFIAMKKVYKQGSGKTMLKFGLLIGSYSLFIGIALMINFVITLLLL